MTAVGASGSANQNGNNRIIVQLDESKRNVMRYVREAIESHRGNGNARPIFIHVCTGRKRTVIRTALIAEYTDDFRNSMEQLLGKQSTWAE